MTWIIVNNAVHVSQCVLMAHRFELSQDICVKCGRCYQICPANKDTSIRDVESYILNKHYYLGHCLDSDIRRKASSGGVVRTIIVEGLRKGYFDGVYTLRKTNSYPFAEGFFFSSGTQVNYDDIPNSVYHSVPLNLNIQSIKRCRRLLVVGTACQLRALYRYVKGKCDEIYSICIYCKQQKTFESTQYLAKLAGENLKTISDLKFVEYRGKGWPGRCQFNNSEVAWEFAASLPFGKRLWCVSGCDNCGNPYGETSDITIMDPWGIEIDRSQGESLFSVNTQKGVELLQSFSSHIRYQEQETDKIKQSLSIDDIKKKNELLPYYLGMEVSLKLQRKGERIVRKRRCLETLLSTLPRMPKVFYKIIFRLVRL